MSLRNKSLLAYIAKCVAGILLCSGISYFVKWIDYPWSIISVLLVLSPEGKDVVDLAFTRIKANVVGGVTGSILLFFAIPHPYNLAIGAAFSLWVCDRLKLNAGARSTLAAMVIIQLHVEGSHLWDAALSRVTAVGIGCFLGLGITYLFHYFIKSEATVAVAEAGKKDKEG